MVKTLPKDLPDYIFTPSQVITKNVCPSLGGGVYRL